MKSTLRILIIPVLLILFSCSAMGQEPDRHEQRREKYKAMKIAYYTENLELTPQEAEKFWPLYNELEANKREIRKLRRMRSSDPSQQATELSEEEAEKIIDKQMEARQKELDLDIKFHQDLKKILSANKILKFYITEVQFREYMLQKFREDRAEGNPKREKQNPRDP